MVEEAGVPGENQATGKLYHLRLRIEWIRLHGSVVYDNIYCELEQGSVRLNIRVVCRRVYVLIALFVFVCI